MQKLKTKVRQAIKGYTPDEMYQHTMKEGGSTARRGMLGGMKHRTYKSGYQVALGREYEQAVNPNPKDFKKAYTKAQKQVGKRDLGTWMDTSINKIVIEPSEVLSDKQRALKIGRQRKQKAIYGFKEKKEFPTGYKG